MNDRRVTLLTAGVLLLLPSTVITGYLLLRAPWTVDVMVPVLGIGGGLVAVSILLIAKGLGSR